MSCWTKKFEGLDREQPDTTIAGVGGRGATFLVSATARSTFEGQMNELTYVYLTASLMMGTFGLQVLLKRFDPFEPVWLFFVGYVQIYIIQALSYHDWAMKVRGEEVVSQATFRAFWALGWFLAVYFLGPGRLFARIVPRPPSQWSIAPVNVLCPFLILWGLVCAGLVLRGSEEAETTSAEVSLVLSFPLVLLVAGTLLIVSGRQPGQPRPFYTAAGIAIVVFYVLIWMFNGKRSHSLIAVLVGICAFYIPRSRRPSFPVLAATAMIGILSVGIAIGWRFHTNRDPTQRSLSGFVNFVSTFDPDTILESVNLKDKENKGKLPVSYETEEWGAFLLMLDTVPMKSEFDYGENYLRVFSTFIPRIVWPLKPIYGREQWIAAWVAGSEMKREANFTGPAIGILGATQLNGGATATLVVLAVIGVFLRTGYEYFRMHPTSTWVQVWWPLFYYNAWFMTVNDDPCNWFYYNYGFTTLPPMMLLWCVNKLGSPEGTSA